MTMGTRVAAIAAVLVAVALGLGGTPASAAPTIGPDGTATSAGCPLHGGPGDIAGMKAVIDWLQGRVAGFDKDANPVVADWDNGKAAMIGKSYDGTLVNGVAATGVAGLTTIIPISAISDWYDYSRTNGVRHNVTHYAASLSATITQNANAVALGIVPPSRTTL